MLKQLSWNTAAPVDKDEHPEQGILVRSSSIFLLPSLISHTQQSVLRLKRALALATFILALVVDDYADRPDNTAAISFIDDSP